MRVFPLILSFCVQIWSASGAADFTDSVNVYIQPVSVASLPAILVAEIQFNPSTLSSTISSFESPELPPHTKLVQVGVYDPATSSWKSSTSATSVENFAKGYQPTFVLTLDTQGAVIGISMKSARIDAGQTREFGPKVKIMKTAKGKQPELNRPVVLSPEGKLEVPEPEKTLLQKYWWVGLGVMMVLITSGGSQE